MKTPSALVIIVGAAALFAAAPVAAKILQAVTEDIAQSSAREFAGSKGGRENNQLENHHADSAPVADAAATARVDAKTVSKKFARGGNTAFRHWVNQKGERSELATMRTEIDGEYWYGWAMHLPEDFDHKGHKTIVMQLASYPTPRNGRFPCNANGPFMHIDKEGKLVFHLQHSGGPAADMKCDEFVILPDITKTQGKWIDFVMHAKWTGNEDGFLEFWVKQDDNDYFQKIDYKGRTWWNDEDKGPYFKMGAYLGDPNWGGPESVTVYTDEFRLGDASSSFDEVAPNGRDERATESGRGKVEYILYSSAANKQRIPIMVYTPPGYDPKGAKRYPVVYNLHGAGGGSPARQWNRTQKTLTRAMDQATVEPMIYVYVNGLGDTFYIDYPKPEEPQVFTSITRELIPFIDRNYRTIATRDGRSIDGFSMGGAGALMVAMKAPELFSSVVSYGAAVIDGERAARWGGAERFKEYSPWGLIESNTDQIRASLKIRMVCGDADGLYERNVKLKERLVQLNIPVDWVAVPGVAHDTKGLFDRTGVESMKFMSAHFNK